MGCTKKCSLKGIHCMRNSSVNFCCYWNKPTYITTYIWARAQNQPHWWTSSTWLLKQTNLYDHLHGYIWTRTQNQLHSLKCPTWTFKFVCWKLLTTIKKTYRHSFVFSFLSSFVWLFLVGSVHSLVTTKQVMTVVSIHMNMIYIVT